MYRHINNKEITIYIIFKVVRILQSFYKNYRKQLKNCMKLIIFQETTNFNQIIFMNPR